MSGRMVILYPNGTTAEEFYTGDEPPLETLQGHVRGYIEAVPGMVKYRGQLCVAYVDEEGLLKGLPINVYASKLAKQDLVGNMVIIVPEAK